MSLTPNFGMNIPDATDIVNLLTQCYPNFTLLDGALQSIKETGVTTASETKSGTVHQLVRTDPDCAVIRFTATSNFVTGDSFTVDGTPVTGVAVNGASLQTGDFVINSNVLCLIVGSVLTLFAGGTSSPAASDVSYDNTVSGLTATNVQNAIDEVVGDIPTGFAATAITYDNSGSGLSAADVQDAIDEIVTEITPLTPISVTTDGVKTYAQLLNQIFTQIDLSKVTRNATLSTWGSLYHLTYLGPSSLEFARARNSMSAWSIQTATLSSASTLHNINSGTYSDGSNSVPGAGNIISFTY